jgi:hypothetical protein
MRRLTLILGILMLATAFAIPAYAMGGGMGGGPKYRIHPIEIPGLPGYLRDCVEDAGQTANSDCGDHERLNPKSVFSGVYRGHPRRIGR